MNQTPASKPNPAPAVVKKKSNLKWIVAGSIIVLVGLIALAMM